MSFGEKLRHTLLRCGTVIAAKHDTNLEIIGQRCAYNRNFFERMANGENLTVDKAEEALAWLSYHWPADKDWPKTFFERPNPKFVRYVMDNLPADRQIVLIPRRGRDPTSAKKSRPRRKTKKPERSFRKLLDSPPFHNDASEAATTAPALTASPPFTAGAGASSENEHEQHKG